ncbi:sit4 phosphatase-associated protein [Podospora conica]|nr:sit4 phosphatase-associated protein [Schizothecium conicum]
MFWRFGGYANISTIESVLNKEHVQLEDLLDESDLLQELKGHNSKLVEYLRSPPVLEKLLAYVVAPRLAPVASRDPEPESDDDEKGKDVVLNFAGSVAADKASEEEVEKKRNRYAFIAAEVLSSENWSICEALMESRDLLRNFWQFVKRPTPLDPLQASYFTKVNESLFDKKTEDMLDLLKSFEGAIPDLLKHVDSPMIMDLVLRIISLERTESGHGVVEWLYTQNLIPILLSYLGPEHNWATQTSAGDFIKAIITVSANASQNEQTCIGPNELTRQLVSRPCVEQLIKYMLGGGNPLTCGVGIVIEVIRKNNSDYDPDGVESGSAPSSRDPIYLGTLLRMFADHVPDFMSLIMTAPSTKELISSTFGGRIEPLRFDRFKTCELMAELLHCSNMGLLNEVGSEEFIASRDLARQRLRVEGRLVPGRAGDASSTSSPEGVRKLAIINSSADDDGFEEVTHAADDDSSGVEELPEVPPASSFLDKDEDDFVDEPLSSPRLRVRELDEADDKSFEDQDSFDASAGSLQDQDLIVAPLSPTKPNAVPSPEAENGGAADTADKGASPDATALPLHDLSIEERLHAETEKVADSEKDAPKDKVSTVDSAVPSTDAPISEPTEPASLTVETTEIPATEAFSPHPEDTPAPLFSTGINTPSAASALPIEAPKEPCPTPVSAEAESLSEPIDASVIINPTGDLTASTTQLSEGATPIGDDSPLAPKLVVGDYLKMQFVEHLVVPTILTFFFKYPWNNFLHNVVYDIVQQVFNGPMDRGYNPTLAVSLFESADITNKIIRGQQASEQSQAANKTRMGYMGHLTLIAEEVVKFTERNPPELLSETVLEKVMAPDWISYVEGALAETRERDNAILGGVRPDVAHANRTVASAAGAGLAGIGLGGQGPSSALAEAGLSGGQDVSDNGGSSGIGPFAISAGTLMSGFGSSSDEDDDDEQDNEEDVNNEVREFQFEFAPAPDAPPPDYTESASGSGSQASGSETGSQDSGSQPAICAEPQEYHAPPDYTAPAPTGRSSSGPPSIACFLDEDEAAMQNWIDGIAGDEDDP